MERGGTGHYETTSVAGESVRAFVPAPLPPEMPLEFTPERRKLLERATLALGRLDSVTLLLPDPDIFLYAYVRREAVLSSQIEGTQSSFSDLLLFELEEAPGVPFDDVLEVSNYVSALNHGMERLAGGFPLSNRLLREMHALLLSRGRGSHKQPGEFRRSQNWLGGTRPGNARFVPPPPQQVEALMGDLERFIHDERQPYTTLVKAALAHVQFETIHPFLDGNGRLGRMLISFILHHEGILRRPLLYLSLYFRQYRPRYYELLDQVRTQGDWEAWLDFFLEGVERTANDAVDTARRLVRLFQEDEARIQRQGRRAGTLFRCFQVICRRPLITVNELCARTGLSYPAAAAAIDTLGELGVLDEITGRKRNRVYRYTTYVSILNEGTLA
ncbi:Fic family protein [Thiolapillus sp.]